jgi:hypothetical protein
MKRQDHKKRPLHHEEMSYPSASNQVAMEMEVEDLILHVVCVGCEFFTWGHTSMRTYSNDFLIFLR